MIQTQIIIQNLEFFGYHGVYAQEKTTGTRFRISIILDLNPELAGIHTDALSDTLNYESVVQTVQTIVTTQRFNLIEHLAKVIADALFQSGRLSGVDITVEKFIENLAPTPQWFGARLRFTP